MFIVGTVTAPIEADTTPFSRGINDAHRIGNNFTANMGRSLQSLGQNLATVGMNITKYISVPLAGAAVAVFKFGKDFEYELSKVTGLVGVAREQVDAWGKDILELSPEIGKAPKELAEALFFVTSAGIKGAEAMQVLEMAGKASAAGLGETKVVADLVTSAMNAYGIKNLSAAQATDILVSAVREGKAEASELASSMGQVLPLASELGVTFDQVAATQASMTRTGTGAAEAATQLKGILAGLIKPSEQANDQLSAMGTSAAEMRKKIREEGLLSALMDLRQMTNKYGEEAMARVFPNIRALMGVLDLMGSNLEDNKKIFENVANSTGILDDAFKAASDTVQFRWDAALSQIQATAIKFFDTLKSFLVPVLEKFVDILGWVGDRFASLTPGQQKIIAGFVAIVGVVGPAILALGTIIGTLGAIIAGVSAGFTALGTIIATIGLPVLAAIAAVIPIIIGYFVGLIAIIGGLIASFVSLYKNNAEFRSNVLNTWNVIKENAKIIFGEIKNTIIYILDIIKKFWSKHGDEVMEVVKTAFNIILGIIRTTMYIIRDVIKLVSALIKGDWSKAWEAVKSLVKIATISILKGIQGMNKLAAQLFSALVNTSVTLVKKMISRIGSAVVDLVSKGASAAKNFIIGLTKTNFVQAGINIVKGLINGIKSMFGEVNRVTRQLAENIRDFFPFSPAKVGPLKDLNKIDFSSSITKSLARAEETIKNSFMGNMVINGIYDKNIVGIGTSSTNNVSTFTGPININGVQDVNKFMNEIKGIIQKHTGRRF